MIVGIDEVGRGALAGPVMAGCVYIPPTLTIPSLLQDSKKLTANQRNIMYDWIVKNCTYGLGAASNTFIDAYGILPATQRAMRQALTNVRLVLPITFALVDGRDTFSFAVPHSSIIRGDELHACISAASILAKVTRDTYMQTKDSRNRYAFTTNKGYGTAAHYNSLKRFGLSRLHRSTFIHL